MSEEYRLQDPGEGIQEAEIVDLHIKPGQQVKEDDILLDVETDKAVVEVPSPFNGTIDEVRVKQGEVANVGDVLFTFTRGADSHTVKETEEKTDRSVEKAPTNDRSRPLAAADKSSESQAPRDNTPVPAAPATRRLARELGVELRQVTPSGPHGRVTSEDVRAFAEHPMDKSGKTAHKPVTSRQAQASELTVRRGEIETVPLHGLRRKIAEHLTEAWQQIPHVNHQLRVDITELEALRQRHKDEVKEAGGHLSVTVFAIKAVVSALKRFPRFNASLDETGENILLKHFYHIGVAVDTADGLLVPVLRDADRKDIVELAVELDELIRRTRAGELKLEEMHGGSFTITNPGMLGGDAFTPLINYPEVAILGLAQARLEPVVLGTLDDYTVAPRLIMPLCLAFDHRINDGADAARFVNAVAEELADPEQLLLKG